ncbi:hypothetical protein FSP39_022867 [Pinctada imbricata]|uniref:PAN2-PAN3 deadenylation complex catalytic subunit PAN2 n=1 Tax=Pinctada imbricata TaxID=66713 RepID=A0AA88YR33_PINIB|nr:hypothetical protein FSP39_022867 [Pinctada imbricata]
MDFNRIPLPHGYPPTNIPPPNAQPMPPVSGMGQQMPPGLPPHLQHRPMMGHPPHHPHHPPHAGGDSMMMQDQFRNQGMFSAPPPHAEGEFTEIHNIMVDGGDRFGVSTLSFDTQELLWMGNQGGHVTGYYGIEMQKYVSFQAHMSEDIRQIVSLDRSLLSLTKSSLACHLRQGIPIFTYRNPAMHNMQCMMRTSPSSVIVGGHQTKVIELDMEKQEEIRSVDVAEPGVAIFRHTSKYICAGDTAGKVTLYDPSTLKAEHVLDAHSGTLSDFDVHGHLLVTCGFSSRHNSMSVDRFLMVYDMRAMRAVAPIQVIIDPMFLRFIPTYSNRLVIVSQVRGQQVKGQGHTIQVIIDPMFLRFIPTYSNRLVIVSQVGQFQLIETAAMTPSSMMMYPIHTQGGAVMSFDISSTCQALAFGDSSGYLHLFSTGDNPCFNQYPQPTEFADPLEPLQPIHINDEITPYSIIPMMYPSNGTLLSDWPQQLSNRVYRKPNPIDPDILRSMKMQHNVGYAKNLGKEKRNQIPYNLNTEKSKKGKGVPESPIGRVDDPFITVPKRYRKVDLKYSKLGLEDFDFRHYNKTNFAGLETDIPNAYCNSMLQILYFIETIRSGLLNHLCEKEFCLGCELGFLFHMLDKQKGQTCQASNFLRAFRTIPEAAALGLVLGENEETNPRINLPRLIQSWQRFLFQQVHAEMTKTAVSHDEKTSTEDIQTNLEDLKLDDGQGDQASVSSKTDEESKPSEKSAESTPPKSKKKKKKKGKKKTKEHSTEEEKGGDKDGEEDKGEEVGEGEQKGDNSSEMTTSVEKEEKAEERPIERKDSVISDTLGIKITTTLRCRCGMETQKQSDTNLINLIYPDCLPQGPSKPPARFDFASVLKNSVCQEQNIQAWCNACDKYQPHHQVKKVESIPDVLAVNCQIENARDYEFWKIQQMILRQQKEDNTEKFNAQAFINTGSVIMCRYGNACRRAGCRFRHERDQIDNSDDKFDNDPDCQWIPLGLKVTLHEDGSIEIDETTDDVHIPKDTKPNVKYFEIFAVLYHIKEDKTSGNLVACVNVGETYHQRKENVTCTQWYLFNDFSILDIDKQEGIQVNMDWKVPCTIYFKRRDISKHRDLTVKCPVTSDVLTPGFGHLNTEKCEMTFTPLSKDQYPKEGDIIGLDAEFVSLNQEESELRSDGTRSMIKPSHLAVARLTCVRGDGDKLGIPFIDDYISTQEHIVDYLTQWSGINPGDLDLNQSTKYLSTLKSTYVKLRYLVDLGVKFAGHGLKKDFRVINITVPKDQIIDTVQLFHIPRQRMISLKFLAWYFLKINIQSSTHDSVEDSNTALQLYKKYQEIGADGIRAAIKEMYEEGRKREWKIPDVEDTGDNPLDLLNLLK